MSTTKYTLRIRSANHRIWVGLPRSPQVFWATGIAEHSKNRSLIVTALQFDDSLCSLPSGLPFSLRGLIRGLLLADAGEEFAGGFVAAGFAAGEVGFGGDQFAPEGFGQDRLRQPVDPLPGGVQLGFQPVGQSEQLLDPPDDLVLFGEGREGDND